MAVASAAANVFALMKLVDALTLIATLASKGVEVTPEKLSRRYPEVCQQLSLDRTCQSSVMLHHSQQDSALDFAAKC